MSAPKTNVEKQRKRHWGPLVGMALVALFGVALIVYWIFEEAYQGTTPEGAEVQIDGRTGEPTESEPLQGLQAGPGGEVVDGAEEEQTVTPSAAEPATAEPN